MKLSPWNPFTPFVLLWRHRDLLNQFVRRTIEQRHRGSFLGVVWTVLTPLLSLALYTFLGKLFGAKFHPHSDETYADYALGVFLGLVLFQFLGDVLALSPGSIVTQPNFVKKVVFPLEILPAAIVGAAAFNAVVILGLALVGVGFRSGVDAHALLLFVILPPVGLIGLGCAWFLSAFGVFVRDIANGMGFFVQVLSITSAVFFPLELIHNSGFWSILRFNPLLHAVDGLRNAVLWHLPVAGSHLSYLWAAGCVICFLGYLFFHKTRHAFADVI